MIPNLNPSEEAYYCASPVETTFTVLNTVQKIAPGDGMRMLLMFGITNLSPAPGQHVQVSTNANMSASTGFPLTGLLTLSWYIHGILIQQPWYMISNAMGGIIVTVTTISLTRWPDQSGPPSLIQAVDNGTYGQSVSRPTNGAGRRNLDAPSWTKRAAPLRYDLPYFGNGGFSQPQWPGG